MRHAFALAAMILAATATTAWPQGDDDDAAASAAGGRTLTLGFAGLMDASNRTDLEPINLTAGAIESAGPYRLQSGGYYRIDIVSDGTQEIAVEGPGFFRNVWVNEIVINDLEVRPLGVNSIEFDDEGTVSMSFVAITPGQYDIRIRGTTGETQRADYHPVTSALAVEDVSHAFGRVQALDRVSLSVEPGRFVALLGINGAGKTTLFSLITRLYDNVTGRIAVFGHDLRRAPGPALAELGVVFQSRALDADLTVAQNLAYHASLHGLSRPDARERAAAVLAQVGLSDLRRQRVGRLSGGQQRRAEIARALLHEPRLLLLDEATVGLDVQSRREVVRLVRALAAETGVGVLWATHLFDEVAPEDAVVLLHRGQVLARDNAADLAAGGTLADAFLDLTGLDREAVP